MNSEPLDARLEAWQADSLGVRIGYSRFVMEELRRAARNNFNRLRQRVETASVRFGLRDGNLQRLPHPHQSPTRMAASSHRGRSWAWSAAGIAVTIAAVLTLLLRTSASVAAAGLSVRELEVGNQLRIAWNHNSPVIEQSRGGALEIEDGLLKWHEELSQEYLRAGSVTYLRTSGNVLVRLLVRGADQNTLIETRLYRGPPPVTAVVRIDSGSAGHTVEKDATDAVPAPPDRERDAEPVAPREKPRHWTPLELRANTESGGGTPRSAPARHRLVLPPAAVTHSAESLPPAPPATTTSTMNTANTEAVMLTPTILRPQPAPSPAPSKHDDQGPQTGKIIWTGKLSRSGTIQILGSRASQGQITGGLPGVPVRVQVFPSELTPEGLRIFTAEPRSIGAPEAPGAQNGWNRTVYVLNPRKASEVRILEAPRQANAWNRLTLRAERGDHSIIVLCWERVTAESALHTTGNR